MESSTHEPRVLLVGATGYTGRLVAKELRDRGISFVPAARSREDLERLCDEMELDVQPIVVDTREPEPLVERLEDQDVVLNCAGPFTLLADRLLDELARRAVTYLDVAGEQPVVERSLSTREAIAREHGATIVHACGFESFFADLLAHTLAEMPLVMGESFQEISSYYWFERMHTSPGTRLTMRLVDHWKTVAYEGGRYVERKPGPAPTEAPDLPFVGIRRKLFFAPYPEVYFFSHAFDIQRAASYLLLTENEARLMERTEARKKVPVEEIVARHEAAPRRGPTEGQRQRQGCGVAVTATKANGDLSWLAFHGRDPYGLTAFILGWAASKLLATPLRPTGVITPGQAFAANVFLEDLSSREELFEKLSRG